LVREKKTLKAVKLDGYVIEPVKQGYSSKWQDHHATNPCVVRLSEDPRVFLGYRAGGEEDYYRFRDFNCWASHLGLAVLDETGQKVVHRLPLPIMTKQRKVPLPKTKAEYDEYIKEHKDEIAILHDFRFFEYNGYLYVIYHEGPIHDCFDCIVRMKTKTFLEKVDQSIKLMRRPVEQIIDQWEKLWWQQDVWQPCGVNGTNCLFASFVIKGDIIFFLLGDGTLQMCHRPFADGLAVLNTGKDTFAKATADGLTTYGTFETCVRPGSTDNSHIGNNGAPTRAKIGDVDVYIDVTHGCHNRMISEAGFEEYEIRYYPYFRVKDYQTGELLYYSEEPILDYGDKWKEYASEGSWVKINPRLAGVMFSGGQIEVKAGENRLDDEFITYIGLGDTAVGAAKFRLRDLLPNQVIEDIQKRKRHQQSPVDGIERNTFHLEEKINGWEWSIENDVMRRHINVIRTLKKAGQTETGERVINTVPGKFDADCAIFDGKSIKYIEGIGWALIYKGVRWEEANGEKRSKIGYGILLLDKDNPEKVLYRSNEPVNGEVIEQPGWTIGTGNDKSTQLLERVEDLLPGYLLERIKRIHDLIKRDLLMFRSQMVVWQKQKSGLLSKDYRIRFAKDD